MFEEIKNMDGSELGFFVTSLDPAFLSSSMLGIKGNESLNLNNLSHYSAINLIKKVRESGINVKRCILDAVGPPEKYIHLLKGALADSTIEIIVESKADDTYPVVSAASICAKVTRDFDLNHWKFKEKGLEGISMEYGCGYPSDPKAKAWLQNVYEPVYGFPSLVRFSWKTA